MSVPLARETHDELKKPRQGGARELMSKIQACEPCRTGGYKRRPCSSCVLQGKKADCYAGLPSIAPPTISSSSGISLTPVEPPYASDAPKSALSAEVDPEYIAESTNGRVLGKPFGRSGAEGEGLYAGATSFLAQLKFGMDAPNTLIPAQVQQPSDYDAARDQRLEAALPKRDIMDGLIDFYFERCTWIFKHVDRVSFVSRWESYKGGTVTDHMVLAGAAIICCIAIYYLPPTHPLALQPKLHDPEQPLPGDVHDNSVRIECADALAMGWYKAFFEAREPRERRRRISTLDEVEVHLARTHFLAMSKIDTEEMWALRGTLVSAALAMGLHRDPGEGVPLAVAERRRWLWWHIVLLERWQAFMHGRPLAYSPDHYDTAFPQHLSDNAMLKRIYAHGLPVDVRSVTDDIGKRTYETFIAQFRLCKALGKITRDALSQSAVPYSKLRAHDAELESLLDSPPAQSLPLWQIANCLKSTVMGLCRQGVQTLVLRMAILHVRFTLHRPYASGRPKRATVVSFAVPENSNSGDRSEVEEDAEQHATSLARAIAASRDVIELGSVATGSIALRAEWSLYAHLSWMPIQVYSAALFLVFAVAMSSPLDPAGSVSPIDHRGSFADPPNAARQSTQTSASAIPGLSVPARQQVPSPQIISATSSQSSNSTRPYAPLDAEKLLPVIHRAIAALRSMSFHISAAKAVEQLEHLGPLYSPAYLRSSDAERFEMKMSIFRRSGLVSTTQRDGGTMGVLGGEPDSVDQTPASQATSGDTPSHYEPVTPSSDGTYEQETPREVDMESHASSPQLEAMDVEPLFLPSPQSSETASMHSLFSAGQDAGTPTPLDLVQALIPAAVTDDETIHISQPGHQGSTSSASQAAGSSVGSGTLPPVNNDLADVPEQVSESSRVMYGPGIVRRCWNCHATNEKTWRTSQFDATKTVCNACGLHERKFGVSRGWPADPSASSSQSGAVSHSQNLVSASSSTSCRTTRHPAGMRPVNWKKDYSNEFTHGVPAPTPPVFEQPETSPAATNSGSQAESQDPVSYYTRPPGIPYDPTDWRSASRIPAFSAYPEPAPSSMPPPNPASSQTQTSSNPRPLERSYSEMLAASSDWSKQHAEWYRPVEPQIEPIISPQAANPNVTAEASNPDAMQVEGRSMPQVPPADFGQAVGSSQIPLQPGFSSITVPPPGEHDPLLGDWLKDFTIDESWALMQSVGLDLDVDMLATGGLSFEDGAGPSQAGGWM
ncbi:unnamed protein product [Peniophora sp. CBMAI 1063]|nr:unnamed protein product [Peniophora sp. CBMAI 1063]